MKRGIVLVAFGKEYEKLCVATAAVSRFHTDLPFCVITNIPEGKRNIAWLAIPDVTFRYLPWPDDQNRRAKLELPRRTPFEETLYMDCDCVIQREGVERVFGWLEGHDIVLNELYHWKPGDKIIKLYRNTMRKFNLTTPISVYNGGLIAFQQGDAARICFEVWKHNWEVMGRGREMPSLACAIKAQTLLDVAKFPYRFFAPEGLCEQAFIQHDCPGFKEKFGLPAHERWTPFDTDKTDFTWVDE